MSENNSNEKILAAVDVRVNAVTSELTKLDEARKVNVEIQGKLAKLRSDEQAALNGEMSESDAIAALTNIHALKSVYGAKLTHSASKIAVQSKAVIDAGVTARQFAAHCQQSLAAYKLNQSVEHVASYFVGHPAEARHLASQSVGCVAAVELGHELTAYVNPVQEIEHGLKRLPANWLAVRESCASESGLKLSLPESCLK
jgi:hypothetical protein